VAVAPRELGLDVESLRAIPNRERLARRFLSEEERRWLAARPAHRGDRGFLVLWTAKEAYLKAVGSGIAMALREVEVDGERPRLLRIVGDPNTAADWTLLRADLPEPAIATAAIRDTGWRLEVSEVDWQEALSQLDSHS
jgi:4'-phosphopantetheinyl transferase